jgi:hypothetical protein
METFDGSLPNLISGKLIDDIELRLGNQNYENEDNRVISSIGYFYTNYVSPNMFFIIVILLLVLYLTIKYIIKKDKDEKKKHMKKKKNTYDSDTETYESGDSYPVRNIAQYIPKTRAHIANPVTVTKQVTDVEKDIDISDIISDDYLITDDTENQADNNTAIVNNSNIMEHSLETENRKMTNDIDRATALVFGQ